MRTTTETITANQLKRCENRTFELNGEVITLRQFVSANDWDTIEGDMTDIINLQVEEEYHIPVHCGYTTIKRLS